MTYNQETKRIETDVHIKPTNIQLFLDWFSNHPYHCKKSIIYCQALRVIMICSTPDKKEAQLRNLRDKFIAVNYPEDVIKKQFEKAQKIQRGDLLLRVCSNTKKKSKAHAYLIFTHNKGITHLYINGSMT